MKLVLLVAVCICHQLASALTNLNAANYKQAFTRNCPSGTVLAKVRSSYDSRQRDRRWEFACSSDYAVNEDQSYSAYVNSWNKYLDYQCSSNKVVSGIEASSPNFYASRRFKIQCKSLKGLKTTNCRMSSYINNWRSTLQYQVPNANTAIIGFYNVFSVRQRDANWKARICDICTDSVNYYWSAWGTCSQRCTRPGATPGTQTQNRGCTNKQPLCAGLTCVTTSRRQICNEKEPCPVAVAGEWGCWSGWSKCSNSCGIGKRTRSRTCNNPTKANGGAECAGGRTQSQTQDCMTTEFKVMFNAGLRAQTMRVFEGVSASKCTEKCVSMTDFTCLSFDYQPSLKKCFLKAVDSSSSTVTHRGEFTGWMHQDKACATNEPIPAKMPKQTPFSDLCHTKNCYAGCGESPYGNEVRKGSDITIRAMNVDLYAKLKDGSIPAEAKKVTVYAQTVILTRTLDITYDLVIVARQVSFSRGVTIRYIKINNPTLPISKCVRQTIIGNCQTGGQVTLYSFYGNGRVDILAQDVSGISCQTEGRVTQDLPKQDLTSLRQAIACANILNAKAENGLSKVANNILVYIQLISRFKSMFASEAEATVIGMVASQVRSEVTLRTEQGLRYLPVLSQAGYSKILAEYAKIIAAYNLKYSTVFDINEGNTARFRSIDAMLTQAQSLVELRRSKADSASKSVKESNLVMDKMKAEFDKANKALEKAQKALEAGVEKYKRQEIMKATFGFLAIIGQIIGAVVSIVVGVVTANPAMVIGGVGGLISTGAQLAKLIQDVIDLAATIKGIIAMTKEMGTLMKTLKAPSNPEEIADSLEKTAEMRVKTWVWENIKNTANTRLASGTIAGIDGCSDFRKALLDVAHWGGLLTEQTLNHAGLVRAYVLESLAHENAQANLASTKKIYDAAKKADKVSNELLGKVGNEISSVQMGATRAMSDYCDTYFYYNFQQCREDQLFSLSDKLNELQIKVYKMANDRLAAASLYAYNPPHPVVGVHVLKDVVTKDCGDPNKCPVTQLKKNRQVQFQVKLKSQFLRQYDRFRVQQVRVLLPGITSNAKVTVELNNLGILKDRFQDTEYKFSSTGRQLFYTFSYSAHTTTDYACVHSSESDILFQVTPFGNWSMSVVNPSSQVDLTNLKQVEVYFLGSAITDQNKYPVYPDLELAKYGAKGIAGECMGGGNKKK